MAFHNHNPIKNQLIEMGYDEYMVDQSLNYVSSDNGNNDNLLFDAMDWLSNHEITEQESKRNNLHKICNIIECTQYQALYALKESQENMQNALEMLVNANLNSSIITNNDNMDQHDNVFSNLSQEDIQTLKTEVAILEATVASVQEERKQQQQWKRMRPIIVSELRSMGFLQITANNAVNAKTVKDKKSAIQWIINHPLNAQQERHAKIQEIRNSGYSENDANAALDRYSQNLNQATSWLMQGKPSKIKHFIYHIETKHVLQVPSNDHHNNNNHNHHQSQMPELSDNINFKNINQQWTLYQDGRIKNFYQNKLLVVKCKKQIVDAVTMKEEITYHLDIIFDDGMSDDVDDDTKENANDENNDNNNKDNDDICKYWEIDEDEKTIKNKQCGLYLVYRSDCNLKFYLEKNIHSGDLNQRWCFVDENELTKLNPKELAKLLDSTDFECIICWENEPNLRLEPCGHSSFCESCIKALKPTECPVCRTKIHSSRLFE